MWLDDLRLRQEYRWRIDVEEHVDQYLESLMQQDTDEDMWEIVWMKILCNKTRMKILRSIPSPTQKQNKMSFHYEPLPSRPTTRHHPSPPTNTYRAQLVNKGYVILPKGNRLPGPLLQDLLDQARDKNKVWMPMKVFQVEPPAPDEFGRFQSHVNEGENKKKIKTKLISWIEWTVKSALGLEYTAGKPVYLKSTPGGSDQKLHTDFIDTSYYNDQCFCASVLIPLNQKMKLKIGHEEYLEVEKNRVLVFTGDWVHAGCAYASVNYRVHAYVIPPDWTIPTQQVKLCE